MNEKCYLNLDVTLIGKTWNSSLTPWH